MFCLRDVKTDLRTWAACVQYNVELLLEIEIEWGGGSLGHSIDR